MTNMTNKEDKVSVEFCVDMNNTESCFLKIDEEVKRNTKTEAAIQIIICCFYSWCIGKSLFVKFN